MENTTIHIAGHHATKLLRMARKGDLVLARPAPDHTLEDAGNAPRSIEELHAESLLGVLGVSGNDPLELLVSNDSFRIWQVENLTCLRTRLLSVRLPPGAFLELVPGRGIDAPQWPTTTRVYVTSPSLSIVYAARAYEEAARRDGYDTLCAFLRVLAFIDECCGSYSRDPFSPNTSALWYDMPGSLTNFATLTDVAEFLKEARGIDGLPFARKVVRYAIDGSGSPMETCINHALTLPPKYAGLSMRKPLVNKQLVLNGSQGHSLKHSSLRPDFQWPEYGVLAEYLGDDSHSSKGARIEDKNRMQDYATTPYTAFPLMFDDVKNAASLNRTALMLGNAFAKHGAPYEPQRLRKLMRDQAFLGKQRILLRTLLPPLVRYG